MRAEPARHHEREHGTRRQKEHVRERLAVGADDDVARREERGVRRERAEEAIGLIAEFWSAERSSFTMSEARLAK